MTWKMSDILILLVTGLISSNCIIIAITLCRRFFEQKINMIVLSHLLKIVIIFCTTIMPALICFVLHRLTFRGKIPLKSDDFDYACVIANQTIGHMTNKGNSCVFFLLLSGWAMGFWYFGIRRITKNNAALKNLEKYSECCKEVLILELKKILAAKLEIEGTITIFFNNIVKSPFTTGTISPKIFLPEEDYTKEEWELLLKHELVHCKNKDYFFRKVVFVLCSLYWFNPFIYKLADYFIEINEMACDEMVLDHQPFKVRSMYAALIIRMQEENSLNTVSLSDCTEKSLERRIRNIMRKNSRIKKVYTGLLSVTIILMCPSIAIAASYGVSEAQDWVVRNILMEEISVQQEDTALPEITEPITSEKIVNFPIQISPREAAMIDMTINGKELVEISTVSLSSNSKVSVALEAKNSSDVFRVGLIDDNNKKRYVQASGGWIDYIFSALKSGQYRIFVEGTTSTKVHITGFVYATNLIVESIH